MLLHSCPDTVHRFPLRKTQTSSSLIEGGSTMHDPRRVITPAVADCRYRAPLSPQLRGNFLTNYLTARSTSFRVWFIVYLFLCILSRNLLCKNKSFFPVCRFKCFKNLPACIIQTKYCVFCIFFERYTNQNDKLFPILRTSSLQSKQHSFKSSFVKIPR